MAVTPHLIEVLLESSDDESDTEMYLDDLRDLSTQLTSCLAATERTITEASRATLRYQLTKLERHSIGVGVGSPSRFADGDLLRQTTTLFNATTHALENGSVIDPRLTEDALRAYRDMVDRFLHKGRKFAVGGVQLTTQFIANIDRLLSEMIASEGSVKGRVERVNIHQKNEFALFTPLSEDAIVCTFETDKLDKVRDAVGRNVTVTGKLHFRGWAGIPERVNVTDLEINPPDEELPTLKSLHGLLSDLSTNGLSAVDFVHSLRDAQN